MATCLQVVVPPDVLVPGLDLVDHGLGGQDEKHDEEYFGLAPVHTILGGVLPRDKPLTVHCDANPSHPAVLHSKKHSVQDVVIGFAPIRVVVSIGVVHHKLEVHLLRQEEAEHQAQND